MHEPGHTRPILPAAVILLLIVGYVLSYPLALKYYVDHTGFIESQIAFYTPVEWIVDETPMRDAIVEWAEMFGCGMVVEVASSYRNPIPIFHAPPPRP